MTTNRTKPDVENIMRNVKLRHRFVCNTESSAPSQSMSASTCSRFDMFEVHNNKCDEFCTNTFLPFLSLQSPVAVLRITWIQFTLCVAEIHLNFTQRSGQRLHQINVRNHFISDFDVAGFSFSLVSLCVCVCVCLLARLFLIFCYSGCSIQTFNALHFGHSVECLNLI